MDDLVAILVILVLAPFVALIWLIVSAIGLSGKVREMRAQLGELAGRLAIVERQGVAAPVEKARPAAARAVAPVALQAEVVEETTPPDLSIPEAVKAPEPTPKPVHAPEPAIRNPIEEQPAVKRPGIAFEDLFGRRLPIWLGGITLAVAGLLIVKYSIDAGLLSPLVRVICGWLFGMGLIAGAELALRNPARVVDPRIRQALAGAGVASLYAAILAAVDLYHLIGPFTALAGMAGVTLLAGVLSLRFGAPSAVLGLLGGLTAPALIHSGAPHIPALAGYLALAIGG
ncbi:MAG: hypothetical protein JWM65_3557, partial [Sphingomonas bacterium]|nr:hypothetical protein [Sphingomonas bacterium]